MFLQLSQRIFVMNCINMLRLGGTLTVLDFVGLWYEWFYVAAHRNAREPSRVTFLSNSL